MEETDYKLEKREINNIKREISKIEEKKEETVIPNLNENEKKEPSPFLQKSDYLLLDPPLLPRILKILMKRLMMSR